MKIKTTAIAMAVAGIVAAPISVQAAEGNVYGSARLGIEYQDTADIADFDVQSRSSRFGLTGETDLGNGMTAYGKYEWDVDASTFIIRHRYAGLKGDFGNAWIGHTYHTFYNFIVGPVDPSYFYGGGAMVDYNGRRDEFLSYAGGAGAVSFGASARMTREAEEDAVDEIELGLSFPIGDTTLAFGVHTTAADNDAPATGFPIGNSSDEDVAAATWSGIGIGDGSLAVSVQAQDDDSSFALSLTMGNFWVVAEAESIDADSQGNPFPGPGADDTDVTSITAGYAQVLGRQTQMIYEVNATDNDCPSGVAATVCDDVTQAMVLLRYDIK